MLTYPCIINRVSLYIKYYFLFVYLSTCTDHLIHKFSLMCVYNLSGSTHGYLLTLLVNVR